MKRGITQRIALMGLSGLAIGLSFCNKPKIQQEAERHDSPQLPAVSYDYLNKHGVDNNLATLGRVLFYDRNLSMNNSVSCGSCHKQEFAFADNVRFNKGFNGIELNRNSPSIQGIKGFNNIPQFVNINGTFTLLPGSTMPNRENQTEVLLFWDGRQSNVADMVLNPVLNHKEMNIPDFESLIQKLSSIPYYPELFKKAYGDEQISKERIAFAMQGFMACLNTNENNPFINNGFQDPIGNENTPNNSGLTELEATGRMLFHSKYNCAQCHDPSHGGGYNTASNPAVTKMFNIGLDEVPNDAGLGAVTGKPGDRGLFKVPTLKNISLTAPYMHDGRFSNLGEVIDHYSHNIKESSTLSPLFRNADGSPRKLNIQPAEKLALIAFLNTLKDPDFLSNPMYADPFVK